MKRTFQVAASLLASTISQGGTLEFESLHFHLNDTPSVTIQSTTYTSSGSGSFTLSGLRAICEASSYVHRMNALGVAGYSHTVVTGNPEWTICFTPSSATENPPSAIHGYLVRSGYIDSTIGGATNGSGLLIAQTGGVYLTYIESAIPFAGPLSQTVGSPSANELIQSYPFSINPAQWTKGDDGKYRLAFYVPTIITTSCSYNFTKYTSSFWFARSTEHIETYPGVVLEGE